MAATEDFLQDASGDWDLSSGDLQVTPTFERFVSQGLGEALNFWEAEDYLDTRLGVPYFRRVIGQKFARDRDLIVSLLRQACLKSVGVGSVDTVGVAFDGQTRAMSVRPVVRTQSGTVVDPGPFIIDEAP